MELKDLILSAEKDLKDYLEDIEMGIRHENADYYNYLVSTITAFKDLEEYRARN